MSGVRKPAGNLSWVAKNALALRAKHTRAFTEVSQMHSHTWRKGEWY